MEAMEIDENFKLRHVSILGHTFTSIFVTLITILLVILYVVFTATIKIIHPDLDFKYWDTSTRLANFAYSYGLPEKIDRSEEGHVQEVFNQVTMKLMCWVVVIYQCMQIVYSIRNNNFVKLSLKDLCNYLPTVKEPAFTVEAIKYMVKHQIRLLPEVTSPYTAKVGIKEYGHIWNATPEEIMYNIDKYGTVIAAVDSRQLIEKMGTKDGIIKGRNKISWPDHAVIIVSYDLGLESGEPPHYKVLNSWGSDIDHQGYHKIAMGENVCGIESDITWFVIEEVFEPSAPILA